MVQFKLYILIKVLLLVILHFHLIGIAQYTCRRHNTITIVEYHAIQRQNIQVYLNFQYLVIYLTLA